MILNETVAAIADAIREKTGKSELIAPVDFASEIKGISGGGSGEGGGSSWRYFDTTKATVTEDSLPVLTMLFPIFKNHYDFGTTILYGMPTLENWGKKVVVATASDFNQKISHPSLTGIGKIKTIEEVFNDMGGIESLKEELGFTEITKEQFYDLNA
jgi:hypothetical protein